jgi:hypothetical protein
VEDTDDLLNQAVDCLLRRLEASPQPASVAYFFRVAAREIRCE